MVCPEEFEQRAGSLCLDDRKNLNRQFPGDEKGTRTQRLASAIKKNCTVWQIIILIFTAEMNMKI